MTDTGWPLIPREVLPPPIPVAKRPVLRHAAGPESGRQLSMFGAETTEPSPADLAGLLAGPGRLGRMGGTARVTVRVDAAWRVHVLVTELVTRGLTASWAPVMDDPDPVRADELPSAPEAVDESKDPKPGEPDSTGEADVTATPDGEEPEPPRQWFDVRTAYSQRLNSLARAWPAAAAQLFLSGPRLRLWVAAAGSPQPGGYALGLDPEKDRQSVESALVRAGLAGRLSDDGRFYLITGRRRLRRLAELVGERPAAAPEEVWPGGAAA
ncbi:hypothetical protein [Actinoplanes sp. GCM10030250]|uniref:hypothetical protein n=1 Tax=Actinoplanes sp. GCM10030250 TaxID=3273376 RepID=UPI003611AB96